MHQIIIVHERQTDNNKFHAQIKDHPEYWGTGRTINEAIGDLFVAHPNTFQIVIEVKKP